MEHRIKLEVDSVFGNYARVRVTLLDENDQVKICDVHIAGLLIILPTRRIVEGRSYILTIKNEEDFKKIKLGRIGKRFKMKENIGIRGTTRSDRQEVMKLQKMLGLRL